MTGLRSIWPDVTAVATLIASAAVLAWPILNGGYVTYMDNPVHLAELAELSRHGSGWSDIAFTGFPIGTLHSPLWYPALAAFGVLLGSHETPYLVALFASFVAPPIALYAVARRHLGSLPAFGLAYLLLVQAPNLRGVGSPLAGMWTHALGASFVILLTALTSRRRLSTGQTWTLALLLAVIGLTHFFALLTAAFIVAVTSVSAARHAVDLTVELRRRALAAAAGALASSAYWLPFLRTAQAEHAPLDVLAPKALAIRLLVPSNTLYLLDERYEEALQWDLHMTDALPMVGLVTLGLAGLAFRGGEAGRIARAGRWMALAFGAALLVHAFVPTRFLGPVPWRHLDWVRIGLALSAIPLLARLPGARPMAAPLTHGLALALTFWWSQPLASDHPAATAAEWSALEKTWAWIGKNADPSWGRLYTLDTFGGTWPDGGLNHSHVLVLTHRETGVPQLGTYYGVVPYRTRWTLSEFNRLFSLRNLPQDGLATLMSKTNAQTVLTSTKNGSDWFGGTGDFDKLFEHQRFAVWRRKNSVSEWIAPLKPSNHVSDVRLGDGFVRFVLDAGLPRSRVVFKSSYHPWWRLEGPAGATLVETPDGFLGIIGMSAGRHEITLRYVPDPWGGRLSAMGWTVLAVWGIALHARRRRPAQPAPRP